MSAPEAPASALQGCDMPAVPAHDSVPAGREGVLEVELTPGNPGRCVATRAFAAYPLKLLIPRSLASFTPPRHTTPPGSPATPQPAVWAFLVSYGGGMVAGDAVPLTVRVGPNATLVLGTQSSTKVYHARGAMVAASAGAPAPSPPALLSTCAVVAAGGLLALLPDPVVAFADARFRQHTRVALAPRGSCVLLDWFTSGRRARGEAWSFASYESKTEVSVCGGEQGGDQEGRRALFVDALRLQRSVSSPLASRMGRAHVLGTLILTGPRVNAHAAALLVDLAAFTARCFERSRATAAPVVGDSAPPGQRRAPFFFAAGSALPGGGAVIRLAAEESDDAYAWARAALEPLHAQLGGAPFRN